MYIIYIIRQNKDRNIKIQYDNISTQHIENLIHLFI